MQNVGLFALLGLGEGALIAALAISVVVFYRGSGTVNLSMGAIAMVASYLNYSFGAGTFGFTPPGLSERVDIVNMPVREG